MEFPPEPVYIGNSCEEIYIGKTNRDFKTRFEEHMRAYKQRNINISNVAEHLIKHKHTITNIENNMKVLEINSNKRALEHLEKYYKGSDREVWCF